MTSTTQTPFDKSVAFTLKVEAGYYNWDKKASNLGGPTNMGITLNTLEKYRRKNGIIGPTESVSEDDVKRLTKQEATTIYKEEYWDTVKAGQINDPKIAMALFDESAHRNPVLAAKSLQKALGVTVDGVIGSETLDAVNNLGEQERKKVLADMIDIRRDSIIYNASIDKNKKDISKGLLNRITTLEEELGLVDRTKNRSTTLRRNSSKRRANSKINTFQDFQDFQDLDNDGNIKIKSGMFRFNDIVLPMPPESIQILIDEYEDSIMLMRTEAPSVRQNGKKRIRFIVNFPIEMDSLDIDSFARMLIQIRKSPIATVDNEKIRKELLGSLINNVNIGVVVDNISGYVDQNFPNLLRCTLQMTWFNHLPYVDEIKYVAELPNGERRYQIFPSKQFVDFYKSGTTVGDTLINDPSTTLEGLNSLFILYKEFYNESRISEAQSKVTVSSTKSALEYIPAAITEESLAIMDDLKSKGWNLATDEDKFKKSPSEPIFYRWRKFEIPFRDLETNGALILQNVSFSLSTNPSYINLEQHSCPTIQSLGGSMAEVRAMIFADAKKTENNFQEQTPIETSDKLAELQMILKKVDDDRIKFPKYAKDNHLLIAHPIAKLLKYKPESSTDSFVYIDLITDRNKKTKEIKNSFSINNFLPVVVSSTKSNTVEGIPFASNFQIDFKETRLAKYLKSLKKIGISRGNDEAKEYGETQLTEYQNIHLKIIAQIFKKHDIVYDKKTQRFVRNTKAQSLSSKEILVEQLIKAANNSLISLEGSGHIREISKIEDLFKKGFYDRSNDVYLGFYKTKKTKDYRQLKNKTSYTDILGERNLYKMNKEIEEADNTTTFFNKDFVVTNFIPSFYMLLLKEIQYESEWVKDYASLFDEYTRIFKGPPKDLYPDMMLPNNAINPAFYFKDHGVRVQNYKKKIIENISSVSDRVDQDIINNTLNTEAVKEISKSRDRNKQFELRPPATSFEYSKNIFIKEENKGKGLLLASDFNNKEERLASMQGSVMTMTPHANSLAQVYPTFQIQLMSDKYYCYQKYSSADVQSGDYLQDEQKDLLDIFDLSAIIDIRIIKDENEPADVMVIRAFAPNTDASTVTVGNPIYDSENFSWSNLLFGIAHGKSSIAKTYDTNLERVGLKEGTRVKALFGYENSQEGLTVEFTGKIAALNGRDIIEIYCMGDGHELIQNTLGYDKAPGLFEIDKNTKTFNSDTPDLIRQVLAESKEVKSFGNTNLELPKTLTINAPFWMGGRSAFDNIMAPSLHPSGYLGSNLIKSTIIQTGKFTGYAAGAYGLLATLTGGATVAGATAGGLAILGGATFGAVIIPALMVGAVAGLAYTALRAYGTFAHPSNYVIIQQTIWDICQEMTLRHPGYICAVIPFDNRSTLFFGEPESFYIYRGPETALEKTVMFLNSQKTKFTGGSNGDWFNKPRLTVRELVDRYDSLRDTKIFNTFSDPTAPFSTANAKDRFKSRSESFINAVKGNDVDKLAVYNMQKTFRTYHLVTSEHDIVSNQIDASSIDVANSVQIYHPNRSGDIDKANLGKQYIEKYELTEMMKADDDLLSNFINNKIFTFHNAHRDFPDIKLPERYAKALLCKELGKIYKGKLTILGRPTVKPHDIVILRDTYNRISGPVGVSKVIQTISPSTGWITTIYPKFLALPDTVSGLFQHTNILKAASFWLADEGHLFYSSLEKFTPSENSGPAAMDENFSKSLDRFSKDAKQIGKEEAYKKGEEGVFSGIAKNNSTLVKDLTKVTAGSLQTAAAPLSSALINSSAAGVKTALMTSASAIGKSVPQGILSTAQASASGLWGVGTATAKTALLGSILNGSTFILSYLLDRAQEGFINWSMFREPLYIFPLKKDGRPWLAALNGFKENTPIEHIELQATRAADKLGAVVLYAKQFMREWGGEEANSYRTSQEVVSYIDDGDTIVLLNNISEEIRLDGIDTAEVFHKVKQEDYTPLKDEAEFGQKAKARISQLIPPGSTVTISRKGLDPYGRTIARIYNSQGQDVSEILRLEGYGAAYTGKTKGTEEERHEMWTKRYQEWKSKNPGK